MLAVTGIAGAEEDMAASGPPAWEKWLDNEYYKVSLDVRFRIELADFDGLSRSEAYTMRTRAGLGTKPWRGWSGYAEMENVLSFASGEYFDGVEMPNGKSVIADPEETELNQLWLRYQNDDLANITLTAGRQRIKLDDDRFIGNVGWRQNEQVFDSVWGTTSLGVDHLQLGYGYIWDVRRIFGDDGTPATHDFDSDSHMVHASYGRYDFAKVTLFTYLLDFDNSPVNSSNSYGFRVTGAVPLGDGKFKAGYFASYAIQTDAGSNPEDYHAHYVAAEPSLTWDGIGQLAVGYEMLGSDDGDARFVTPLATAHKFNGWADVFLDNGGPDGLHDLYVGVAPSLPWKLKGKVVYHHFWSDQGGDSLGDEVDAVLSRSIGEYVDVLTKAAWFDGTSSSGRADRWRWWFQVTFHY